MATVQSNSSQRRIDLVKNIAVAKRVFDEEPKAFIEELNSILVA